MREEGNIKMSFSYNYIKKCVSMFSDITAARMWCFVLFLSHWLKSFPLLPHFFLINFCSTKESSPWTAPAVFAASLWNGRALSRALPLLNRGGPAGGFPKTASSSFRSVFTWRQVTSHCSAPKAFASPATQRGGAPSRAGRHPRRCYPTWSRGKRLPKAFPQESSGRPCFLSIAIRWRV